MEVAEMGSAIDFTAARGPGSQTEWVRKRDVLECRGVLGSKSLCSGTVAVPLTVPLSSTFILI